MTSSFLSNSQKNFGIENIIKCSICSNKIIEPCMCPFCQKLFCEKCINKFLIEKNSCPNCNNPLKMNNLIHVSFMNSNYLGKVSTQNKKEKSDICSKHDLNKLYYCVNCKLPLCSDCYMLENTHKEHEIKKIQEIYENNLELIKKEKNSLKENIILYENDLNEIKSKIIEMGNYKYKKIKELEESYHNIRNNLNSKSEELISDYLNYKNELEDKINNFYKTLDNINNDIKSCSKNELIEKTNEITKNIHNLNNIVIKKPKFNLNKFNFIEFENMLIPPYETEIFEIKNFTSMKNKRIIFSPNLILNGIVWRIKLYPKGNNSSSSNEYLSIFLELIENVPEPSKYYYIIELINYNNRKNFYQEYSSNFSNNECWGYSKFYRLDKLKNEGFISNDGKLCIKIHVRPDNYLQLKRDLDNYIQTLKKNQKNVDEIKNEDEYKFERIQLDKNEKNNKSFEIKFLELNSARDFLIKNNDEKVNKKNKLLNSEKQVIKIQNSIANGLSASTEISNNNKNNNINDNNNKIKSNEKLDNNETNNIEKQNNNTKGFQTISNKRSYSNNKFEKKLKNLNINAFNIGDVIKGDDNNSIIEQKNQSLISDDSFVDYMDSIKVLNNIKDNNNKNILRNNTNFMLNSNNNYYLGNSSSNNSRKSNGNSNSYANYAGARLLTTNNNNNNNNFMINYNPNNQYIYKEQFERYKQKYNIN